MANDFIDLNISMSEDAKKYLDEVTFGTANLANTYVGKTIKNARSQAKKIEGHKIKVKRGNVYYRNGEKHVTESYWDRRSKSLRTLNALMARKKRQKVRKNGDTHLRLQNFTYRKAAGTKKGSISSRAEASLTSNFANLHENDVFFPNASAPFSYDGGSSWSSFGRKAMRSGRHYFDQYKAAALAYLSKSEEEALKAFDEEVRRRTEKI